MKHIKYSDIAAISPEIKRYLQRLRPTRHPLHNPWLRYEQAKRDLLPLIPELPGAYEAVIGEIVRRLRI